MNTTLAKGLPLTLFLTLALSACKSVEPLYYHGDYNQAVYSFFKADDMSIEEQIDMMQNIIAKAAGKGKPVAPGVHAHLGMLYFETGNADLGHVHFEKEKHLFPESAKYLNFLLNSAKGA